MKQRIVLCRCYGKFENVADKVRHHGAAAAALRIHVSSVRNRHVKGKCQGVIPIGISVKDSGSESVCTVLRTVPIDEIGTPQEFLSIIKEAPIMIQVLDSDLKSPGAD